MLWFSAALLVAGMDLFEAGQGGYMTYRIPGLVKLGDGTLLAYAEARKDGAGDWADIDVVMRRSVDGGASWSDRVVLADVGTETLNNVIAIAGRGKHEVHLIYCVGYARAFYRHSVDSGKSFTEPVEITSAFEPLKKQYDWNVIATGPGHGIRLRSGRLLIPVWLSTGGKAHRPSVVSSLFSDDEGKTWKTGEIVLGPLRNPSETVAVELKDGRVMMNLRSESDAMRRAVVYSKDGASGWSVPEFVSELKEPVCMASLLRYPSGKKPLLFVNPDHVDADAGTKKGRNSMRRNLTLQGSWDEGRSWKVLEVIDPEISAYSDLAVNAQGEVLVLYEKGGRKGNMYFTEALRLVKIQTPIH